MKLPSLYSFPVSLAVLVLAVTSSYAQTAGTDEKGATGWSGATKGQDDDQTGKDNAAQTARDAEAAKGQPFMAEGIDLKGPPRQFAPRLTPE